MVDNIRLRCIYIRHTARRRSAEWRASEAPHFSVICHRLESVAAASQALWRVWGEGWRAPGCLIGESEERETWTAESLRAAHVPGSIYVSRLRPRRTRLDETSAVHVSGQHHKISRSGERCGDENSSGRACARKFRWDLVKRCDQPE